MADNTSIFRACKTPRSSDPDVRKTCERRRGTPLTVFLLTFPAGDTRGSWGRENPTIGRELVAVKLDSEGTEVFRWQVRICLRVH